MVLNSYSLRNRVMPFRQAAYNSDIILYQCCRKIFINPSRRLLPGLSGSSKCVSDSTFTNPALNGAIVGGETTYYSPPTLQPATQYWWHVFSTYQGALSGTSNYASFYTEPECTSQSQLIAPVIIYPKNGASVDTLTPTFNYIPGTPGCIPDHYFIDLQTDQNFQGVTLLGALAFPTTVVGPSIPLSDCTMYYLKVAAVQDGNTGPYSNIHRFYVNEQGTCFPSPIGKVNQNVFCKIGPDWDISSYLFENGDTVMVVGRNANSSQIQVLVPDENHLQNTTYLYKDRKR